MENISLKQSLIFSLTLLIPMLSGCADLEGLGPVSDKATAKKIRFAIAKGEIATEDDQEKNSPEVSGTGWATLRGTFTYAGTPPVAPTLNITKDFATCSPNGKKTLDESLLVDADTKGIRNIVIYARKVNRIHASAEPNDKTVLFDQKECIFLNHIFTSVVGQTIIIKNSDDVGHNTNIQGKKNKINVIIPAGKTAKYTPKKPEPFPAPASCSIHPWMKSYIFPHSNGYVAVTAKDGSFEIPNLPAGEEIEIQVWHEIPGGFGLTQVDKALGWNKKGRFKIRLSADETKELNITVPASVF